MTQCNRQYGAANGKPERGERVAWRPLWRVQPRYVVWHPGSSCPAPRPCLFLAHLQLSRSGCCFYLRFPHPCTKQIGYAGGRVVSGCNAGYNCGGRILSYPPQELVTVPRLNPHSRTHIDTHTRMQHLHTYTRIYTPIPNSTYSSNTQPYCLLLVQHPRGCRAERRRPRSRCLVVKLPSLLERAKRLEMSATEGPLGISPMPVGRRKQACKYFRMLQV